MAAPGDGQPISAGVPDSGSRPTQVGSLVLPNTPISTTPVSTIPGSATNKVLHQIEQGRIQVDQLGDQLLQLKADRDLAQGQVSTAQLKVSEAQTGLQSAQTDAVTAAGQAMQQAAAVPPGALDSGLLGLDQLARLQRGEKPTDATTAQHLESAEIAAQIAIDEQTLATEKYDGVLKQYEKLNATLTKKQAAQQKLEAAHKDELAAAESVANAADQALGAQYLGGASAGRGADPRAIQALQFALAQRGDPYVWSEEGPDAYDCSGLIFASYHSVGYPMVRVSRDQYWQTRNKVVDRYSLVPGDLLFFSYTNSWTGIHHVAMYAGNGMMVEAPRTGLNVRLVPVRWSQLFQATRVFGSVEGGTTGIPLGTADPEEPATGGGTNGGGHTGGGGATPSTKPTTKPSTGGSSTPTKKPRPPASSAPAKPSPTPGPSSSSPSTGTSTPAGGSSSGGTSSGGTSSGGTSSGGTSSGGTSSGGTSSGGTSSGGTSSGGTSSGGTSSGGTSSGGTSSGGTSSGGTSSGGTSSGGTSSSSGGTSSGSTSSTAATESTKQPESTKSATATSSKSATATSSGSAG
ncbi:Cortactin-binding protein 2 [Actinoplanes sp. SE50]|nr:Cortactin-binding protein 2 [Actinoplanes sp. SE50/110]ATO79720.1 Cortactin-binding protein 2 [Actinoplanes sp. SE50]SLL97123.1 Cortactin-binding protein 2 [Actinoplanes sp. SE50/110]